MDGAPGLSVLVQPDAGWRLTLCPAAGEAGGSFVASVRSSRGGGGGGGDPERSRLEAGKRAKGRLRRYCVANGLDRLGTLTYRGQGCHDQRAVRDDIGRFFRVLRESLGGDSFPYLWVPEWHPGGHGLHVHFAVGQYVKRSKIVAAWEDAARGVPGQAGGRVDIRRLSDIPVGASDREPARVAAGYLAKYVAKTFDGPGRLEHLKRYDVAEGFQPQRECVYGSSCRSVIQAAAERMGADPAYVWLSARDAIDWQGPPAVFAQWD